MSRAEAGQCSRWAVMPVADQLRTVTIICELDRRAHEITEDDIAAGRRSGNRRYQAGEQSLLVQGEVASRTNRSGIDGRRIHPNLLTDTRDGIRQNLRNGHVHQLAELRLVISGDINRLIHYSSSI